MVDCMNHSMFTWIHLVNLFIINYATIHDNDYVSSLMESNVPVT